MLTLDKQPAPQTSSQYLLQDPTWRHSLTLLLAGSPRVVGNKHNWSPLTQTQGFIRRVSGLSHSSSPTITAEGQRWLWTSDKNQTLGLPWPGPWLCFHGGFLLLSPPTVLLQVVSKHSHLHHSCLGSKASAAKNVQTNKSPSFPALVGKIKHATVISSVTKKGRVTEAEQALPRDKGISVAADL